MRSAGGTQKSVVDLMQTRVVSTDRYLAYERKLDRWFAKEKAK